MSPSPFRWETCGLLLSAILRRTSSLDPTLSLFLKKKKGEEAAYFPADCCFIFKTRHKAPCRGFSPLAGVTWLGGRESPPGLP